MLKTVWVADHHEELSEIITGLVAEADRYGLADEEREWIDELARDVRDDELTPSTMVFLGLATAELRTSPAVLALNGTRPYRVHILLAHADTLRSQFADLGDAQQGDAA